ncbi:MAG: tyrosine-protein phosphatase [Sedimentisphaerales bacterium]|nr:tyrosine-protein phosphatase [Sedimentisphaerales bacterium]
MSEKIYQRKFSVFVQSAVVIFLVLLGAGYYYYRFDANANLQVVVPGKVYRSAQPSPFQLKKWANKYGIRTIVNLRSKKVKEIDREKMVTEQLRIELIPIYLSGNRLVSSAELLELMKALETAERPILIHCKSGIDRAGFVSALAAFAIGDINFDTAKNQAYVPPGPWKRKDFSKVRADYIHDYAHISDTLKLYENYCRQKNMDENDWENFMQWAIEISPKEDLDIEYYKPVYSYFPFLSRNKHFIPIRTLLKESYLHFSIQILIVVLLIYYTKFCLKSARHKKNNRLV